jgi:hypothetical protein
MAPPGKRIRPAGEPSGPHETTSGQQVDTDTVPRRTDKAQQDALKAIRRAEQQRGRQGRLPRHVSYRRSR